jgi:hypothetical protein
VPDGRPLNRPVGPGLAGSLPASDLSLLDLADRLLNRGVVVAGEATISVAGIDLIYLGLNLVLASVETLRGRETGDGGDEGMRSEGDEEKPGPVSSTPLISSPHPLIPSSPHLLISPQPSPPLDLDPDHMEEGLARLVLTLVELIRQLLERQAIRRMDGGSLSEEEVERLGLALMRLQEKLYEMAATFGLQPEDLNINLGPLGNLL